MLKELFFFQKINASSKNIIIKLLLHVMGKNSEGDKGLGI